MSVHTDRVVAVWAVTSILRAGGRSSTAAIANDIRVPATRTRRALELALRERLVFSRDRNAWTTTTKARELFAEGQRAAA